MSELIVCIGIVVGHRLERHGRGRGFGRCSAKGSRGGGQSGCRKRNEDVGAMARPIEVKRGERFGRELTRHRRLANKGSLIYSGDAIFRSNRNGARDTAAWTESRRGKVALPENNVVRNTGMGIARKSKKGCL